MRWDADKALAKIGAINLARQKIDTDILKGRTGINPTSHELKWGYTTIWILGAGVPHETYQYFYGRTLREAYLKARKTFLTRSGKPRPVKKKPKKAHSKKPSEG